MFLLFSFIIAYALNKNGVLRRIAISFIYSKVASKSKVHLFIMVNLAVLLIGSFMAPTVTFIIFLPILEEIYKSLNMERCKFTKLLTSSVAISTSISCAITPFHTFPLMAIGFYEGHTGLQFNIGNYFIYSIPVCLIIFVITMVAYCLILRKDTFTFDGLSLIPPSKEPFSFNAKFSIVIFSIVVIFWFCSGIFTSSPIAKINTAIPPMVGSFILLVFNIISFDEAFTKAISWKSIVLCASTLALGKFFTDSNFGVVTIIKPFLDVALDTPFTILLFASLGALVLTNLMSNIVTTTLVWSLCIVGCVTHPDIIIPMTTLVGLSASLAAVTPPSIAHIAISGSNAYNTPKAQALYGMIFMLISVVVLTLFII